MASRSMAEYFRNRRIAARAAGLCGSCFTSPVESGLKQCRTCIDKDAARKKRNNPGPDPFIAPSVPSLRVLRALRFFDWADCTELMSACGAPDHRGHERGNLTAAISRLLRDGHIEKRRVRSSAGRHAMYVVQLRITDTGRAELASRVDRLMPPQSDFIGDENEVSQ